MDMESSSLGQIQWNFFSSICVEREGVCVLCGVLGMEAYYHQRTQINGTSSCVVFMEGVREGGREGRTKIVWLKSGTNIFSCTK